MYKFLNEKGEHRHELEGKPLIGTSTVLSVLSKDGLLWWALQKGLGTLGFVPPRRKENGRYIGIAKETRLAAATDFLSANPDLDGEKWLSLLDTAYTAHTKERDASASKGTDRHAELERYVKHCLDNAEGRPVPTKDDRAKDDPVVIFADWATRNVKRFLFSESHCYSRDMWVGGIADCGYENNQGEYVVLDFKSSKEAYLPQFWQCAGYDLQLSENGAFDASGNLLWKPEKPFSAYAVLPFGMPKPEVVLHHDTASAQSAFKAALLIYKLLNQTTV